VISRAGQLSSLLTTTPLHGFRNLIINGDFDVWQRGDTFIDPGAWSYTADRWRVAYDGSPVGLTVSRHDFALGQTGVPGEPRHFLRWQMAGNSGATFMVLAQPVEGVRTLAGQMVTVTFYARAAAPMIINFGLTQFFGTGGSPSADVLTLLGSAELTTEWTRVSAADVLPSMTGKSLGTNGNDALVLNIFSTPNEAFTIDIAHVSLVHGDATAELDPFAPRHIGQEIALCQRYYQRADWPHFTVRSLSTTFGTDVPVPFPVIMRATPTVTLWSPITLAAGKARDYEGSADVDAVVTSTNPAGFYAAVEPAAAVGNRLGFIYEASAEL